LYVQRSTRPDQLLAFRDGRGFGLKDIAISRERGEFLRYIKELETSIVPVKNASSLPR
jgi:hypothetical protein